MTGYIREACQRDEHNIHIRKAYGARWTYDSAIMGMRNEVLCDGTMAVMPWDT